MRNKKAKLIRKLVNKNLDFTNTTYKKDNKGTITLNFDCTRAVYQRMKRVFKQ